MTKIPVAGVVWQTAHFLVGLERLGFDVYYVEAHARTPTMFMEDTADYLGAHCAHFTYAENYGTPECRLRVSDRFDFRPTRQPVVIDLWRTTAPPGRSELTTIASWQQPWRNLTLEGEVYYWSKDREFIKFLDLPARTHQRFELALA